MIKITVCRGCFEFFRYNSVKEAKYCNYCRAEREAKKRDVCIECYGPRVKEWGQCDKCFII